MGKIFNQLIQEIHAGMPLGEVHAFAFLAKQAINQRIRVFMEKLIGEMLQKYHIIRIQIHDKCTFQAAIPHTFPNSFIVCLSGPCWQLPISLIDHLIRAVFLWRHKLRKQLERIDIIPSFPGLAALNRFRSLGDFLLDFCLRQGWEASLFSRCLGNPKERFHVG